MKSFYIFLQRPIQINIYYLMSFVDKTNVAVSGSQMFIDLG